MNLILIFVILVYYLKIFAIILYKMDCMKVYCFIKMMTLILISLIDMKMRIIISEAY